MSKWLLVLMVVVVVMAVVQKVASEASSIKQLIITVSFTFKLCNV